MKTTHRTASALAVSAVAASGAHAAMTGVTATNYQVADGARRYSVMDGRSGTPWARGPGG
jgi:hypothetical protein